MIMGVLCKIQMSSVPSLLGRAFFPRLSLVFNFYRAFVQASLTALENTWNAKRGDFQRFEHLKRVLFEQLDVFGDAFHVIVFAQVWSKSTASLANTVTDLPVGVHCIHGYEIVYISSRLARPRGITFLAQ